MDPIRILLVEDSEGDVLLISEALEEGRILNTLRTVSDGHQAMLFLGQQPPYQAETIPDLILLDINLPKKNGHEVLHFIKNHPKLKCIPVIMLTTSSSEADVYRSYHEHANCFITKPVDVDQFLGVIATIEDFWINIVRLPGAPHGAR
ncbi:MAG: response regulator [Candidatus Melainabacteria bacterium HGW-Melainabacteria-1]|nr:MAG: response regulator [Candidatus Melainabacteria bacterium HGW-Melainabacteria-1]